MKFKNKGKDVQVRIKEEKGYKWERINTGETIDLPEKVGLRYRFEKVTNRIPNVTEGKIGKTKVETKQFEDDFLKELENIKGIGKKTARDIIQWGTKEKLIEKIKEWAHLPFRDDIEEKLRRKYGKK